jgi:hypothetical protein
LTKHIQHENKLNCKVDEATSRNTNVVLTCNWNVIFLIESVKFKFEFERGNNLCLNKKIVRSSVTNTKTNSLTSVNEEMAVFLFEFAPNSE